MRPGTRCGEGGKETNWSGKWFHLPFLSVPRTSSLHHPKSSDILCRRVYNTTATSGSHLVKQVILRWERPTHWTLKRLPLSPTESSYKFLLSWMSGRPFSLRCCSSHWLHSLLHSSAHTLTPQALLPHPLKILYSRTNGINKLNIPSLPPSFLLQLALYTVRPVE